MLAYPSSYFEVRQGVGQYVGLFCAYANRDIEKTKTLIEEAKVILRSHDDPEYAPLFYSVGTSLMIIRDAEVRKVEASDGYPYTDSCVINLNSDLIWYLRHAEELVDQIEATEDTIPYLIGLKMILYVNLGNALDFCGRKCFAIDYYSKAVNIKPFGMGFGNIGICLEHYAELEGDPGHRALIFKKAYECYCEVEPLDDPYTYPKAKEKFRRNRKNMEKRFGRAALSSQSTEYKAVEFKSERESDYRHWCLRNHLFLNTLNDLPEHNRAFMTDSLQITSITTGIEQKEIPFVFEMFNQVKEEYIYSRYLLYEVVNCDYNVHYADKETHLDEVLNYSAYSIRLEKLKTAFRTAYSIFDRIAFLLNSYLNLGIEERQVNFKGIWKSLVEKEKKNIAIGALHWINRDFTKRFGDSDTPHSRKLMDLRNALEHKFVAVHMFPVDKEVVIGEDFIYRISEDNLIKYTMDLLKLVREAVIELTVAIRIEEHQRHNGGDETGNIEIFEYMDEFKR